jgi:hypothetical protein
LCLSPVDLNLEGYVFIIITYKTNNKLLGIEFIKKHYNKYS